MGNRNHRCAGDAVAESLWRPARAAHSDPANEIEQRQRIHDPAKRTQEHRPGAKGSAADRGHGIVVSSFANITIRLLGSDDFPPAAKHRAATDLTTAAQQGALSIPISDPLPLHQIAEAHNRVDAGARERVLLSIPS